MGAYIVTLCCLISSLVFFFFFLHRNFSSFVLVVRKQSKTSMLSLAVFNRARPSVVCAIGSNRRECQ